MQHTRSLAVPIIATICIIIGDSILRLTSLGKLPMASVEWMAVVGRPELLNAVIVVGVLFGAQRIAAATILTATFVALLTTAAHRWMLGSVFTINAMIVTAIIFFVLSWVSLWIANTVTQEQES